MPTIALAAVLAIASVTTTGPDLAYRFEVRAPDARVATDGERVLVAAGDVLEVRGVDGVLRKRIELPCAARDVVTARRAWAVLCADRVLLEREGAFERTERLEATLVDVDPVAFAVQPFFGAWAVAAADGLVQRGRFPAGASSTPAAGTERAPPSVDAIDLRARPLGLAMDGIDDVVIALDDGSRHLWSGRSVEDAPAARPALLEVGPDVVGVPRARVTLDVVTGAPRSALRYDGARAVAVSGTLDAAHVVDVAVTTHAACMALRDRVVCWSAVRTDDDVEPAPVEPRVGDAAPPADDDADAHDAAAATDDAPLDVATPGALAAMRRAPWGSPSSRPRPSRSRRSRPTRPSPPRSASPASARS